MTLLRALTLVSHFQYFMLGFGLGAVVALGYCVVCELIFQ